MNARLTPELELTTCPHCNVSQPSLRQQHQTVTKAHDGQNVRFWGVYGCSQCGGIVTASALGPSHAVLQVFPEPEMVEQELPERARQYLTQAIASLHAPAGAVMLAASAVDAMLKEKQLLSGTLYSRIEAAAKNHLITDDMKEWAHDVRLDANDQRHADQTAALPNEIDARRVIDFARGLALILFVLPARVQRGREAAKATG